MANNSTLLLILAQVLVVAVIAAIFLGLLLWRVRRRYRRLLSVYATLKREVDQGDSASAEHSATDPSSAVRIDWPTLEADALARYQAFAQKTLGDYSVDDPFSARIASIRYHYLQAEQQAESSHTEHERWQLLEKALSKLVSIIVSSGKPLEAHDADKISLLRERMKALKNVEKSNADLRGQNQRYDDELKRLRQYYQKYRAILAEAGAPSIDEGATAHSNNATIGLNEAHENQRQLVDDMHGHINSEPHKTIYQTREGVHEQVDELKAGVTDYDKNLAKLHQSLHQNSELDKLTVIESLRGNNHRQRNTITNLYQELNELRHSLNDKSSDKNEQTKSLERMLNECESCIATLESEVAYLQEALEQSEAEAEKNANLQPDDGIVLAEVLLDFSKKVVENTNPDEVLAEVADTFAQLNLPYMIGITFAGKTDFSGSANLDNALLRKKLADISGSSFQERNTEGLFFSRPCLQVFIPEEALVDFDFKELTHVLEVMHTLVKLQLQQHLVRKKLAGQKRKVSLLADQIRTGVANIDIQYAYQTEEVKNIVASFLGELEELLPGLGLDDEIHAVYKNILDETQQRFALLHEAGSSIDNEFSRLSVSLDELLQQ
ncbi:hypothetical protein [Gilvimarinus polysaccharolyticus]|uniref:hypothetical protein n=1 Tax=Gilvimarinus polysaccharolyticus TaxID=863921 RepID=UPI000673727F|nr:hypothetical protein [Gilvimarinus polysaccharolyticus]